MTSTIDWSQPPPPPVLTKRFIYGESWNAYQRLGGEAMTTNNMPDLTAPVADLSGAQLTPETMTAARIALQNARRDEMVRLALSGEAFAAARWGDGDTQFVLDDTIPPGEVYFLNAPLNPNSVASRIQRGEFSQVTGLANGEPLSPATCHRCGERGPCVPRPCGARECHSAVCIDLCVECVSGVGTRLIPGIDYGTATGAMMGEEYRRAAEAEAQRRRELPRMEWYTYGDGSGDGLQRCEQCGNWRPCRRVIVAERQPVSWTTAEFDPVATPPMRDAIYCNDCARGRR